MDEPDEIDDDFDDDFDPEEAAYDEACLNCGLTEMSDGRELCMNAGTEWCDFMCPFRDEAPQFRVRERKPADAPLLDLIEKKPR